MLPGVLEIGDGTPGIAVTRKMHHQLCSDLPGLRSIAGLLAGPDLLMQAYPVPGGYTRIDHLVIKAWRN